MLFFPNRDNFFNSLNGIAACFKRVGTVRGRHSNDNGYIGNFQSANPVYDGSLGIFPFLLYFLTNLGQLIFRHWYICLIFEKKCPLSFCKFSYNTDKRIDPTCFIADHFFNTVIWFNRLLCYPKFFIHQNLFLYDQQVLICYPADDPDRLSDYSDLLLAAQPLFLRLVYSNVSPIAIGLPRF